MPVSIIKGKIRTQQMLAITTLVWISLLALQGRSQTISSCHYTCESCVSVDYYQCLSCKQNRGEFNSSQNAYLPVAGMCYCSEENDENGEGVCESASTYNYNNKALIVSFIALCLILGLLMAIVRGMRYYFLKTIEDVQELSLIVFINLYFPQQFDIFLTHLYRFNISSFTFESLANGSLFIVQEGSDTVISTDGQNIYGKYKLLYKTANFFSNSFTWIIVAACILTAVAIIWGVRKYWKKKFREQHMPEQSSSSAIGGSEMEIQSQNGEHVERGDELKAKMREKYKLKKAQKATEELEEKTSYKIVNRINNMSFLSLPIIFLYFSVIELNINIFTQIGNLTFSSSFAAIGAFFSAVFLALEILLLFLLMLKTREESMKPEWMRDYTYSPCFYLIRVNFKTLTKYFFFICCIKKILLALMVTLLYSNPVSSIIGLSTVQAAFILVAIYCEPYQRRYLRIHFYLTEGFKLFMYVSLLNFSEKYVHDKQLIDITQIFYIMLALIFGFHFCWILIQIFIQWKVYWFALKRKYELCCSKNSNAEETLHTNNQTLGVSENQLKQKEDANGKRNSQIIRKSKQDFSNQSEIGKKELISQVDSKRDQNRLRYPFEGPKIGYHSDGKMYLYEKYY